MFLQGTDHLFRRVFAMPSGRVSGGGHNEQEIKKTGRSAPMQIQRETRRGAMGLLLCNTVKEGR